MTTTTIRATTTIRDEDHGHRAGHDDSSSDHGHGGHGGHGYGDRNHHRRSTGAGYDDSSSGHGYGDNPADDHTTSWTQPLVAPLGKSNASTEGTGRGLRNDHDHV
ncbi:hypothetical protein [Massilia antarctica]|uniref:hypothetical protein n=1 Tax=Massilia antarctica TaxID=2765360 RepID=UPI002270ACB8|nr:hypothetical protein [Massilia sp. H27-R4]MCY0915454.1 hypothetical protein [Massilia sp. H27-R4]